MKTIIYWKKVACALLATCSFFMSVNTLLAQKNITLNLDIERTPLKYKGTSIAKKIDPMLLYARDRYESGEQLDNDQLFHVRGNEILIKAIAETPETADKVIEQFKRIGLKYTGHYERVINGFLPFEHIEKASKFEHLMNLTYSPRPMTRVGLVTSEGDAAMKTDIIKKGLGFDGTGVKVCILSDSYNSLGNAEQGVLNGDLPGEGNPNGYTTPVEVFLDLDFGGSDEGRAMAELIHDVAPGAALSFYSAFYGEGAFAQGIIALSQFATCDIIVDDVFYTAEPFFQDGVIAKAVDIVVDNGTTFFSAAGNNANYSYEATFNPAGFKINFANIAIEPHIFPNGDIFQPITLPAGSSITIGFQWDEPAASLSGFPGSRTDYNLFVLNEDLSDFVTVVDSDNLFKDPIEVLFLMNPDTITRTYNLLIGNYIPALADPDNNFKLVIFRGTPSAFGNLAEEFNTGTIVGHSNAKGAITVGAAPYFFTPAFGFEKPIPENFTSLGGVPIIFDEKGTRLKTPIVRDKPEITAPDGTNTSFFGEFDLEGDGFPNFFGTSAAAPHAAAAAALVMQAYRENGRSTSPDVIKNVLQSTAIDIVPTTIDRVPAAISGLGIPLAELQQIFQFNNLTVGFDYLTGAGLIDVERALSDFTDQIVYVDLALTASTVGNVKRYVPNTLSFELTNSGDRASTGIVVSIELPKSTPLVGGARPVASTGTYDIFTSLWSVPSLGVGESATLNLKIFPITLDFEVFAQVMAFNELDIDSRPANGSCCVANEDDEVVFRSTSTDNLGLGITSDFATIDATLMVESIYPNPVTNQTTVIFYSQLDKVNYTIQDVNGRTVLANQWNTEEGVNRKTLDLAGLAEGVYFLKVDKAMPQRIVKLK